MRTRLNQADALWRPRDVRVWRWKAIVQFITRSLLSAVIEGGVEVVCVCKTPWASNTGSGKCNCWHEHFLLLEAAFMLVKTEATSFRAGFESDISDQLFPRHLPARPWLVFRQAKSSWTGSGGGSGKGRRLVVQKYVCVTQWGRVKNNNVWGTKRQHRFEHNSKNMTKEKA
jgi:hypothetical protein